MKVKKTVSLMICATMLISMCATGCGQTNAPVSSSSGSEASQSVSKAEPEKAEDAGGYQKGDYTLPISKDGVTLRWMGRDSEEPGTSFNSNKSIVWEEVQKRTGITIEWDVIPNQEYLQIMQVRLSSQSDLPDVICIQGQSDGSSLVKYYDEKVITPLNSLIADYAPNIQKVFKEFPAYKNALTLPSGEIVALGSDLSATPYRTKGVSIRQDWLDKVGMKSPTNMDELYAVAKAFVEKDPNGNGKKDEFGIQGGNFKEIRQLGMGFGLSLVSGSGWSLKDGKLGYEFISPEYKEFMEWLNKAYAEGILPKDFQSADGNVFQQRIASNTLGIIGREYINECVALNNPAGTAQKNTPGAVWRPIDFVEDATHKLAVPTEPLATIWRSYAITENCKDKVAAIRLLDYVFAHEEGRILSTSGVEGVTYNKVNGVNVGIPNWRDNVAPGTFMGDSFSPKMITNENYLGFTEVDYLAKNPELKKQTMSMIDSIINKAYQPFQPCIPSLEDGKKLAGIATDLNTYIDEMYVKFITGEAPLSEYDKYVENCRKLGCDTMRDIYQAGYDNLKK